MDAGRPKQLRRERVLSLRELEERRLLQHRLAHRGLQAGAHPRTIRKLAEALGVEPAELVRGEGRC